MPVSREVPSLSSPADEFVEVGIVDSPPHGVPTKGVNLAGGRIDDDGNCETRPFLTRLELPTILDRAGLNVGRHENGDDT